MQKIHQVRAAADLEAEVEKLVRAREGKETPNTGDEAAAIRRRIEQIDHAVENAAKRSLMVEDDEVAESILLDGESARP